MAANDTQVGGKHYQEATGNCPHCRGTIQHWDLYGNQPYLVGQATKYATRQKNGFEDLQKAVHFLEKLAETRYGRSIFGEHEGKGKPEKVKVSKYASTTAK